MKVPLCVSQVLDFAAMTTVIVVLCCVPRPRPAEFAFRSVIGGVGSGSVTCYFTMSCFCVCVLL